MADHWQNRIVDHGEASPEQLVANPRNWRKHPAAQRAALERVLDRVGWVQDVIVNRRTSRLVDGHLRAAVALERHEPTLPVLYVDLDETEEALVLATLDPLAAMADADRDALSELVASLAEESGAVQDLLDQIVSTVLRALRSTTTRFRLYRLRP